jgi:hypothetical protein
MSIWQRLKAQFKKEPPTSPPTGHAALNHAPPYTLGEKQRIFARLVGVLIVHAYREGYELTFGEAFRTKEQAEWNAKKGIGIKNSLHRQRLAIDLNLFVGGAYKSATEAHKPLGEFWEGLSFPGVQCCWGGRFGDGGHYSISHGGRK